MHSYSDFWRRGGVLTASLWAAQDAAIVEATSAAATASSASSGGMAAALLTDVLELARVEALGTSARAEKASAFLYELRGELRGELATFAPSGPPPPREGWRPWCAGYVAALRSGLSIAEAYARVGVNHGKVRYFLRRNRSFAVVCDHAREAAHADARREWPAWCGGFLGGLWAGKSFLSAAQWAGVGALRPRTFATSNPDFAEALRAARAEGARA
jgi:hypothetical protein